MSDHCKICGLSDEAGGTYIAGDYWFCESHASPDWIVAWAALRRLEVLSEAVDLERTVATE